MRLLGSSRQMFSTNMGGSMISTVLYPQVPSVCCRLAAEDVMTTCCSEAKRQRQRGLQVCFVQRAFLASQTKPYVKRTSNAACMMARWHKKFMTSSDAQVQTHRQTLIYLKLDLLSCYNRYIVSIATCCVMHRA